MPDLTSAFRDVIWSNILHKTGCQMIRNRMSYVCLLTDSELANSFCLRYWAMSPAGKWNESFQVLLTDSGLNKAEMIDMLESACRLYFPRTRCADCGNPLSVTTRSEYSSIIGKIHRFGKALNTPFCISCSSASINREHTRQLSARKTRQNNVAEVLEHWHEKAKLVDYAQLSFFQSCLLYSALLAANLAPGQSVVPPLRIQMEELAPTQELADQIYARFCTDGIFLPVLSPDLNAFILDEENDAITVDIRAGSWRIADDVCGRSIEEVLTVLFRRLDQPEPKEIEALWYLVAEDECRRYFVSQWERYNFAYPSIYSAKVSTTLQHYLGQCSIGQMWNVIYYAVKNLAALTQEGKHTPQHIYNMLPGAIRRYADYRLANGQPLRPWHRPSPTRASWLTNTVLDKVLKAGDACFGMLKGQDVVKYVEYLIARPIATAPETWFSSVAPNSTRSE
jgi:hypothetical protein